MMRLLPFDRYELLRVGFIFALVFGFGLFAYRFEQHRCTEYEQRTGMRTQFSAASGCFVEVSPDQWVLLDQIRISTPECGR